MDDVKINNIIEFDDTTGLKVSSKGEILEDLNYLTKVAYGSDYVIEQGNEWYSFLDLLAGALTDMSGAIQKVYNTLSFVGASGTNLDNVVSFAGITRKPYRNSRVLIKIELPADSERPFTFQERSLVLEDINKHLWTNIETILIEEYKSEEYDENGNLKQNYIGTGIFEATDANSDPTNIVLQPYNDGNPTVSLIDTNNVAPDNTKFMNEIASELGNLEENDAQLRARYKKELYKNSVGTLEGLKAALLEKTNVSYVNIIENNSESITADGLPPHSIWVIVDGTSTWDGTGDYSNDPDDIAIGNTILNYSSLGCAISNAPDKSEYAQGKGPVSTTIAIDSKEYKIDFSRAHEVKSYVYINLVTDLKDSSKKNSIEMEIKNNLTNYITNLGIGNDILQSGLSAAVYSVITENDYKDYVFDIDSITVGTTGEAATDTAKRLAIKVNEYPITSPENIKITWN